MSVWYCIPSARQPAEADRVLRLWRQQGYRIALFRDTGQHEIQADLVLCGEYPGYAQAVNALVKEVLDRNRDCWWCVAGGDDVEPDLSRSAVQIAAKCTNHFDGTFGVMQPTGDGHGIETICGSPWMGREWCQRINGGVGPLWPEYHHNFVDNEIQEVAKRLGVFWQRPDLTHKHNNWMWTTGVRPKFLDRAYSRPEWDKAQALFLRRKAAGFPGHEPLSHKAREKHARCDRVEATA